MSELQFLLLAGASPFILTFVCEACMKVVDFLWEVYRYG